MFPTVVISHVVWPRAIWLLARGRHGCIRLSGIDIEPRIVRRQTARLRRLLGASVACCLRAALPAVSTPTPGFPWAQRCPPVTPCIRACSRAKSDSRSYGRCGRIKADLAAIGPQAILENTSACRIDAPNRVLHASVSSDRSTEGTLASYLHSLHGPPGAALRGAEQVKRNSSVRQRL